MLIILIKKLCFRLFQQDSNLTNGGCRLVVYFGNMLNKRTIEEQKKLEEQEEGEYAALLEIGKIDEWMDKNPGIVQEGKLSFLQEINEESNPVMPLKK